MDKIDPRIDDILTKQIRNITIGVATVLVVRNLSQAASMVLVDVGRRVVDLKLPVKYY